MTERSNMPSLRMLSAGLLSLILLSGGPPASTAEKPASPASNPPVSYYKQIRPIFQARCQGCHQPAKDGGGYVMTEGKHLLAAGDSGKPAIVPGKPGDSELLRQIMPAKDGKATMPKKDNPLHSADIDLISRWIAEGARDDTPANATFHFDDKHPPVYTRPPVITGLDFSPDGRFLAVAGFHEVLLTNPDEGKVVARLIGLSERVQSVKFSPDGTLLAVVGGNPGRLGEIQIWGVAQKKLLLSKVVGFDTLYGASWSPDGKLVAVGCPDNNVRAFDAATGEERVQQGAHSDWVLGTAFARDGSQENSNLRNQKNNT
jgi:mono/diheme cytochrome c family protein/roadblock/LC7 domain-containing protein